MHILRYIAPTMMLLISTLLPALAAPAEPHYDLVIQNRQDPGRYPPGYTCCVYWTTDPGWEGAKAYGCIPPNQCGTPSPRCSLNQLRSETLTQDRLDGHSRPPN